MIRVNVGISKKVPGQQQYSSDCASCHFEVEADESTVDDHAKFRDELRQLFAEADAAVVEQLGIDRVQGRSRSSNGNGHGNGHNGNDGSRSHGRDNGRRGGSQDDRQSSAPRLITPKQLDFLLTIGRRTRRLDEQGIAALARDRFGIDRLNDLTTRHAYDLIQEFQGR